jgi:hypothetical protein
MSSYVFPFLPLSLRDDEIGVAIHLSVIPVQTGIQERIKLSCILKKAKAHKTKKPYFSFVLLFLDTRHPSRYALTS